MEPIETNVKACARCGLEHPALAFAPFSQEPCGDFTHWTPCPTNGEPILLRVRDLRTLKPGEDVDDGFVGGIELDVARLQGFIDQYDEAATRARNALRDAGIPEVEGEPPGRALDLEARIRMLAARATGEDRPRIQAEVSAWAAETFGCGPARVVGAVAHFQKEARELDRAAARLQLARHTMRIVGPGGDGGPVMAAAATNDVVEEAADCAMLLFDVAGLLGADLIEAVRTKLEFNRKREWGAPDADGVVEHVREAPPNAAFEDPSLACPAEVQTATGHYDPSGPEKAVRGADGLPYCAGCGSVWSQHVPVRALELQIRTEIERCEALLAEYRKIPTGAFGARVISVSIANARGALVSNDAATLRAALEDLRERK